MHLSSNLKQFRNILQAMFALLTSMFKLKHAKALPNSLSYAVCTQY